MNNQIITQDLGNGYFLHQLNIQTRTLKQTISAPMSLRKSQMKPTSVIKSYLAQNQSKFQSSKLHQYVAQSDWINNKGQLIKFASIQNNKVVVNPQAIKQFNRYPNNQISFIGNYGRKDAGKSFWYDKILNLSGFQGNHYSNNNDKQPGLYIWNIPFTKGDLKFFMIDFIGYKGKDQLSEAQKKLLDLQLILSQKFIVVSEPHDSKLTVLRPAYNHLIQSKQRFSNKNIKAQKFTPYWPNEIYTLYRTSNPVKKQIDNIGILFETYNFSIIHDALKNPAQDKKILLTTDLHNNTNLDKINPKYVKMSSLVFKDIYDHMKGKQYDNVKTNGKNIGFIIDKSLENINNGKPGKMDEMFSNVKGDIYGDALIKSRQTYLKSINYIIVDKNPRPIDQLTKAFDKANRLAYQQFDKQNIDPQKHDYYEKLLQDDINKIQRNILQENKLKTYQYYKNKLPQNSVLNQNDLQVLKNSFIKQKRETSLDHNDTTILQQKLANNISMIRQDQQIYLPDSSKKRQNEYKRLIQRKVKQYQAIKKSHGQLKGGYGSDKQITSETMLIQDDDVSNIKPDQYQLILSVLQGKQYKNDQQLSRLKGRTFRNPQVDRLNNKLQQYRVRNSQIELGLSSIDKSSHSLRPRNIKRPIKKDNYNYIKKVAIK